MVGAVARAGVSRVGGRVVGVYVQHVHPHLPRRQRGRHQDVVEQLGDALEDVGVPFLRRQRAQDVDQLPAGAVAIGQRPQRGRVVVVVQVAQDDDISVRVGSKDLVHQVGVPLRLHHPARLRQRLAPRLGDEVVDDGVDGHIAGRRGVQGHRDHQRRAAEEAFGGLVLAHPFQRGPVAAHQETDVNVAAAGPLDQRGLVVVPGQFGLSGHIFQHTDVLHFLQADDRRHAQRQDGLHYAVALALVLAAPGLGRVAGAVRLLIVVEVLDVEGGDAELVGAGLLQSRDRSLDHGDHRRWA